MSEPGSPQPTEQHAWLMTHVGTWTVDCAFYMDPSQPPMKVTAKDTCEAHGPFFTIGRFEADMFGMPYVGIATVGYDPTAKHFVSTWVDTMNPQLYQFTGQLDATGRVLEMKGQAPFPNTATPTQWRTVEEHLDDGSRKVEMFVVMPDGPELKFFTYIYRRA